MGQINRPPRGVGRHARGWAILTTVFLMTCVSDPVAYAQPGSDDAAFHELAERLLTTPSASLATDTEREPTKILPGRLPDDAPFDVALPPGGRLVGSSELRSMDRETIQIVLDFPGSAEEAVAFYSAALGDLGWSQPQQSGTQAGGFQASTAAFSYLCSPVSPTTSATVNAGSLRRGVADVHITIYTSGPIAARGIGPCAERAGYPSGSSVLPPLHAPAGVRVLSTGQSAGSSRIGSTALLESTQPIEELASQLGDALEASDWSQSDAGVSGPIAWSMWDVPGGELWGILQIVALPAGNEFAATIQLYPTGAGFPSVPSTTFFSYP